MTDIDSSSDYISTENNAQPDISISQKNNEDKSYLLHDIANSLTALSCNIDFLAEISGSYKLDEFTTHIESSKRNIDQIKEMIATARTEHKEFSSTESEVVRVLSELKKLRKIFLRTLENKNIDFYLDKSLDHQICIGISKFKQLFLNLLINAVDSYDNIRTFRKKKRITVFARLDSSKLQRKLVYYFIDNGVGMKPEVLARLQQGATLSTKRSGTGLGLRIIRKIVEDEIGGMIFISSSLGYGTAVELKLPLEIMTY